MAKLTRRNTIIGLGALVGGSGALAASGAFTSVEADRSVNINTAGDGSALLQLEIDDSYAGITDSGSDTIGIQLDNINENAVTTFDAALTITNNGNDAVSLSIDDSAVDGVTFTLASSSLDASGGSDQTTADIEVDTTGTVSDGDITITANDSS